MMRLCFSNRKQVPWREIHYQWKCNCVTAHLHRAGYHI